MAGLAIYFHFDFKAQALVNPSDSWNCDILEKKVELHLELIANLSAVVSEPSKMPQDYVSSVRPIVVKS